MIMLSAACPDRERFSLRQLAVLPGETVNRWHYLGGKFLAVAVFVNLMTTLPALVLFLQYGLLASWRYFIGDGTHLSLGGMTLTLPINPLLLGIVGYGMVLTVCMTLVLLATATWLRRTVPMIMVWTTFFLFMRLLGTALVDGLNYDPHWRLIDMWNSTYLVATHAWESNTIPSNRGRSRRHGRLASSLEP